MSECAPQVPGEESSPGCMLEPGLSMCREGAENSSIKAQEGFQPGRVSEHQWGWIQGRSLLAKEWQRTVSLRVSEPRKVYV